MSMLAERAAQTQATPANAAGTAGQDARLCQAGKPLSLKAQRALRGAAIKGNGPGGRVLGRGEDVPLVPEASERLGVLFAEYGDALVHYARRKLLNGGAPAGVAVHLAEEIAQEAWVEIARTGAKDLLRPDAASAYSADETRWMLWARVKTRILAHYKRSSSHETAVDWEDRATVAALCPLLEDEMAQRCRLGALTGYLAPMVAALPETEREALLTVAYAVPLDQARELLKDQGVVGTRDSLVARAVLRLLIDNPELSGPTTPPCELEAWERAALRDVSWAQRQLLLRAQEFPRQVLLLHLAERLNTRQIAERLGVPATRVKGIVTGCAALAAALTTALAA
ncbi:hypothetical protein OG196_44075 (plasmid) [Kitasatospora purpeofusca]|uniref:hypothetical protein n=1 Tax=Kitasatospora purpeofusca TaxID=67352 RepID=UPI002E12B73F|nr:hypothetical protein OG196_44075 [Kitasatospora purpeofusca]